MKCCFSKPVVQQLKLVGPTNENQFFLCYQTLKYVVAGEPHPQSHIISFGKKKKCFSLVGPTKIQDETAGFGEAAFGCFSWGRKLYSGA
jgi:hypothetical protein